MSPFGGAGKEAEFQMKRHAFVLAVVLAGAGFIGPCAAQSRVGPTGTDMNQDSNNAQSGIDNTLDLVNQEQFRQKRNMLGLTAEQLQAKDKADLADLVKSAQFQCEVTNAQEILEGTETIGGKSVKTKTYEGVCSNGLGYFIVGRGQGVSLSGFTCFAADATLQADLKAHRSADPVCTLPEISDIKAIASNVLLRKGHACQVRDVRWVGISPKSNTDFTEIACGDGTGFILASPLPGSTLASQLVRCRDSAAQGMPCKLSDNGEPIITLQTFKDALAQHHVACDVSDERVIGKESVSQRHVVEFSCTQRPEGLVAYIPLSDSKAPFETYSCADAAKRGVVCKLTPAK